MCRAPFYVSGPSNGQVRRASLYHCAFVCVHVDAKRTGSKVLIIRHQVCNGSHRTQLQVIPLLRSGGNAYLLPSARAHKYPQKCERQPFNECFSGVYYIIKFNVAGKNGFNYIFALITLKRVIGEVFACVLFACECACAHLTHITWQMRWWPPSIAVVATAAAATVAALFLLKCHSAPWKAFLRIHLSIAMICFMLSERISNLWSERIVADQHNSKFAFILERHKDRK